ncbi:unnamed protein product, partial [Gongylonema pulchrum]|uniref:MAM domain-containing protein n=1 Tax=Gongylonema pulchrum TaxID=637853 RepID=A0A183DAQ6_9BILA
EGCFPGYAVQQPYYPRTVSASRERVHADAADFNVGNDDYPPPQRVAAPSNTDASLDVVQRASDLNCHDFDSNCRWSNTNEDEMDWAVLMSTPDAEPWLSTLQTTSLPGHFTCLQSTTALNSLASARLRWQFLS